MTHDEKIRFLDNLDEAIKTHQKYSLWQVTEEATVKSLQEVRIAFAKAVHMENYTKDLNPPAV